MAGEGFFIDHVIYGVVDIDRACERLRDEHGLGWVEGGRHLGGTTDRFVPLADRTFLEVLGVGDTSKDDGAWLEATLQGQDRILWWCLGCDDLDETARRRGLPVQVGAAHDIEGNEQTFRTAGMPRYPLPFFMAAPGSLEYRTRLWQERYEKAGHTSAPGGFTWIEVGDPPSLIDNWLGPDHGLPVRYAPTAGPGARGVGIASADGEIVIR